MGKILAVILVALLVLAGLILVLALFVPGSNHKRTKCSECGEMDYATNHNCSSGKHDLNQQ